MKLIATTNRSSKHSTKHSTSEELNNASTDGQTEDEYSPWNVFKSANWTPDGSSVLTVNEDNSVRLFVIPPDVLNTDDGMVKHLKPYATKRMPTSILSLSIYPGSSIQPGGSVYSAIAVRDVPVRLYDMLDPESKGRASFGLLANEEYLPAYATQFSSDGYSLAMGTKKAYAVFDINRPGTTPVYHLPIKGGIVSTLSHNPRDNQITALGEFDGRIRLIDQRVEKTEQLPETHPTTQANMQLLWTDSSEYILQVCRDSCEINVLDVRSNLQTVGQLAEFPGQTNQRLHISLSPNGRVHAGGHDGSISTWTSIHTPHRITTVPAHNCKYHTHPTPDSSEARGATRVWGGAPAAGGMFPGPCMPPAAGAPPQTLVAPLASLESGVGRKGDD
ncbi:Swt21p [Sugiyamaella lignohabitans]|uniref:Protein SWT21 n=1 Tax=Sugiyamaella lignohabitans TaxID=796027 RepID=A0A167CEG1_9ASCO|nr:Swt21p [Sugiyamaella lignohabitans]ANB11585.1 Swt21p [Sugiyamaella lignohabitans]